MKKKSFLVIIALVLINAEFAFGQKNSFSHSIYECVGCKGLITKHSTIPELQKIAHDVIINSNITESNFSELTGTWQANTVVTHDMVAMQNFSNGIQTTFEIDPQAECEVVPGIYQDVVNPISKVLLNDANVCIKNEQKRDVRYRLKSSYMKINFDKLSIVNGAAVFKYIEPAVGNNNGIQSILQCGANLEAENVSLVCRYEERPIISNNGSLADYVHSNDYIFFTKMN
ncbi:MAG TPA: hypothetical protein PKC21_02495 [Oligoflexia bacterium]|nr:hypothetical protein [Oligoflexia bacterium]HMR24200.1 hypothetical protein [Oligoflexia bacterium]